MPIQRLAADHPLPDRYGAIHAAAKAIPAVYRPSIVVRRESQDDESAVLAAVLATQRPHTRQLKLSHPWGESDDDLVTLVVELGASTSEASGSTVVSLKLQGFSRGLAAALQSAGVLQLANPEVSGKGSEPLHGFNGVLPLESRTSVRNGGDPIAERLVYTRQRTEVTCGPVAALTAAQGVGLIANFDAGAELSLWRSATCFPGCDPVGLGVALTRHGWPARVNLSTQGPVLIEHFQHQYERDLGIALQERFWFEAASLQVPVMREPFALAERLADFEGGARVLLLIDEYLMHQEHSAHWVAVSGLGPATANPADRTVYLIDPWLDAAHGETWLDGWELPVRAGDLERMLEMGEPAYRGAVVF